MLRTDGERLEASLLEMARLGATSAGGVSRLSLSDEDRRARDLFVEWARKAGLSVRVDDLGTIYARLEGTDSAADPVLVGSHLDSVPAGGKFDGALGVLMALEVARTLRDAGVKPRRPIDVVDFTNEEGARFQPAMVASGVLAGCFTPEFVYGLTDHEGRSFGAELERVGYRGSRDHRPKAIHAYLEAHIEQGPILEQEGLPLAVVEGIVGIRWWNVTLVGQSQHAGPSPMRRRRDPMVAAGRVVAGLRDLALEYPDPAVVTVGRFQPTPGIINQIPSRVALSVDIRDSSVERLEEISRRAEELIHHIAAEERVEARIEVISQVAPPRFDENLVDLLEQEVRALGLPSRRIVSSAGHDAQYISRIAPTAMLFVRTVGGMSHCETEAVDWVDVQAGADVLLHAVLLLAEA